MTDRTNLSLRALLGGYAFIAIGVALGLGIAAAPELGVLAFLFALAVGFLIAGTTMIMVMTVSDVKRAHAG